MLAMWVPRLYLLLLLAVPDWALTSEVVIPAKMNFTVFSAPVRLRYGQVWNKMQPIMDLPDEVIARYAAGDTLMAVSGFDVEMIRKNTDGSEAPVPLSDHYLHHYALFLGHAEDLDEMLRASKTEPELERMLSGCHAMMRAGVHAFMGRLHDQRLRTGQKFSVYGSASGGEYRHNPQRFEDPFRLLLQRPKSWAPLLHIINTNLTQAINKEKPETLYSPLLECPCTPQRRINVSDGTIDGKAAMPPIRCSPDFAATGNPSCSLATYVGGWRCCEHEVFLVDTDKECAEPDCSEKFLDEVVMKFTFFYEDSRPDMRLIEPAACCDVTSDQQGRENIEYDVPACAHGTPPEKCVHMVETVQPIGYFGFHPRMPTDRHLPSDLVDLVFAAPHLHTAGISLELLDAITNETLCEVHRDDSGEGKDGGVIYGRRPGVPGDEEGYLVGLSTCRWSGATARRFRRDHPMRARVVYNATHSHTGVMSLWLAEVSAVDDPDFFV